MSTRTLLAFSVAAFLVTVAAGCASNRITLHYRERPVPPPFRAGQPVLDGSINNVSGYFVIDTGTLGSAALTQNAIDRCGISAFPYPGYAFGVGGKITMMEATNVTIRLAKDYTIHCQRVAVVPQLSSGKDGTNDVFLGLLGYETLAERHAVIDIKHKTITFSK